jgi:hypothetical protein
MTQVDRFGPGDLIPVPTASCFSENTGTAFAVAGYVAVALTGLLEMDSKYILAAAVVVLPKRLSWRSTDSPSFDGSRTIIFSPACGRESEMISINEPVCRSNRAARPEKPSRHPYCEDPRRAVAHRIMPTPWAN